mgnify:CR=1 FL=1
MASWVEITNPIHGGVGWEFGTCLWSPVMNKGGRRSWELLTQIRPGDRVFHLLKEKPGSGYYLTATSVAAALAHTTDVEPPEPGQWKGMAPYYRVPLEGFFRLSRPISIDNLLKTHRQKFERELTLHPSGQFFERKSSGTLKVSLRYIARATGAVVTLFESVFREEIPTALIYSNEYEHFIPTESAPAYPDYTPPGIVESRIIRRIRDTSVSKQVKERYQYQCVICGYRILLSSGKYYAEAHHLKPLGAGHDGPDSLDNLIVLCPTHHAEFDYGAIAIEPSTKRIMHRDPGNPFHGQSLAYEIDSVSEIFLTYHLKHIFGSSRISGYRN